MATAPDPEANGTTEAQSKPPFLRRVHIQGYKSIAFCDVTLEPLTILVGRNASGKSNFLDALGFLRDVVQLGASEGAKRHGGADTILCRMNDDRITKFTVECVTSSAEYDTQLEAVFALEIEFPKKQRPQIRSESLLITDAEGGSQMGYSLANGTVTCFADGDETIEWEWGESEYPFLVRYHNELRTDQVVWLIDGMRSFSLHNFQPSRVRQLQRPSPGSPLDQDGANLASVIEAIRENDKEAFERVGRYLSVITESVELVGLIKYGADYETVRFRVRRNGQDQSLEFDAASMSDGTLRVLAALAAAFQHVEPLGTGHFLVRPSLVAIEEPETSLHPAAMRALVDALDEATLRTQILLTTHSADMLDNPTIKPENVRVVEMIDGQTVIGPVDEASVEIVRQKLDTLGGLERQNQLQPDLDDLERQRHLSQNGQGPKG
jgi:predicted ATPase